MIEGERICPTCRAKHKGEGLPPSLANKLHICSYCYKNKKKKSDKAWRAISSELNKSYKKKYRLAHPEKTRQEWKDRTARWKQNKKTRRENKNRS